LTESQEALALLEDRGLSERRACQALAVHRSSLRYEPRPEDPLNAVIRYNMLEVASVLRHCGTPKMAWLLKNQWGMTVNHKRVERMYDELGLRLPQKEPRKRYLSLEPAWERPCPAEGPNEVWTMDFVHVMTHHGLKLRLLTVLDEGTRECLDICVRKRSFTSKAVIEALDELFQEYGVPQYIRVDNGPEFANKLLQKFLADLGVKVIYIDPGCPWQNGFIESFNGKLRIEFLDGEIILSGFECQVLVDWWRQVYNWIRPHRSLGGKAPAVLAGRTTSLDSWRLWTNALN